MKILILFKEESYLKIMFYEFNDFISGCSSDKEFQAQKEDILQSNFDFDFKKKEPTISKINNENSTGVSLQYKQQNKDKNGSDNANISNNSSFNKVKKDNNDDELKKEKMLQKKRNKNKYKGVHNKYSSDNIIRKIKIILLNNIKNFINSFIYKIYKGNIKQGILTKQLKKVDPKQCNNIEDYKRLLNKTLKDIFSFPISKRYSNFFLENNKYLFNELLNEEDEEKREIFTKIFNLTFLECLDHFSGKKIIEVLKGLKSLDEECYQFDDEEYSQLFKAICLEFEANVLRKKSRNKKS